jgi:manganese efflux pump family protein
MGIFSLILLSIGLSFDTFAVSLGIGLIENDIKFLQATRISAYFGFFQAIMPILGWCLGYLVKDYIIQIDHWLAFILLLFIGSKMIYESFSKSKEEKFNPHDIKVILLMSLATTIDAFVIGITFAFLNVNLINAFFIIGFITFIIAMLGMLFGKKIGIQFGKKMEILGGGILILIGLKILLEHLLH